MDEPTIYPASTARSVRVALDHFRRRAAELHAAADALDRRGDPAVASTIRSTASSMDRVVAELQQKADLLRSAESLEWDAADLHRDQVADLRARADVIRPDFPHVDPVHLSLTTHD
jgi:hypothetical protein